MQIRDDRDVEGKWEPVCDEHTAPAEDHLPPDPIDPRAHQRVFVFCLLIYSYTKPLVKSSALSWNVHKKHKKQSQKQKNSEQNKSLLMGEETDTYLP